MEPIARGLPPELRSDVAAYYANINAPFDPGPRPRRAPERGRVLATEGDNRLTVQACRNCHGPGGVGEPPNIPFLAGLQADYIASEMIAWKEGTRTNDAGLQMFTVATAMTLDDINAVAQYYASLTPPAPAPLNLVQAPSPQKKLPPGTTPMAQIGEQKEKGVGVEQGAPMTGGTPGKSGTDISRDGPSDGKDADDGDVLKSAPSKSSSKTDGTKRMSVTETPDAAPKTKGSREAGDTATSKAPSQTSGTQWPRLSDAAKADTAPVLSNQRVHGGNPARGRAILASGVHGCAACHTIPGIRAPRGIVGPPLGGLSRRSFIAGQLPNRPETLVAFLQNPPALVPQTGMPNVGLTGQQARHIAAYLYTLEANSAR